MKIIHQEIKSKRCPYGQNLTAQHEWITFEQLNSDEYLHLMLEGYRRNGMCAFMPVCASCHLCAPLRVDAQRFKWSKGYRRIIKRNKTTEVVFCEPSFSDGKLELVNSFLAGRSRQLNWPHVSLDRTAFEERHVITSIPTMEIKYIINGQLVGLSYSDILSDGLSSNYNYYDLDYCNYSLGHFDILTHINYCNERRLRWIYMGWYIKGYQSFEYKASYTPNEIAINGEWIPYMGVN